MKSGITSSIKSGIMRPTGFDKLSWAYSISTPGTDPGRLIMDQSTIFILDTGFLSTWIKKPTGVATTAMVELYSDNSNRLSFYYNLDLLLLAQVKGGAVITNSLVGFTNDGGWHHLTATWDSSSAKVYVDAVLKATFTGDKTLTLSGVTPKICFGGAFSASIPSAINTVGIVMGNAKLTDNEVFALYKSNASPVSTVVKYNFARGVGTSTGPTFGPGAPDATLGTGDLWTTVVPTAGNRLAVNGPSQAGY